MPLPTFKRFNGVDSSGLKQAGVLTWVAEVCPRGCTLTALQSLTAICGSAERASALAHLVGLILASERALWGFDFPVLYGVRRPVLQ